MLLFLISMFRFWVMFRFMVLVNRWEMLLFLMCSCMGLFRLLSMVVVLLFLFCMLSWVFRWLVSGCWVSSFMLGLN